MRVIFCLPNTTHNYIISHLDYNIMERLDRRLVKFIYYLLHTNNSTVQSIVNSKLLLYSNSVLSENYKYLMSKYKISHLDWNLSLLHVLNKIEVPPLSVYELSVCNTVSELCQHRDNLYSCEMYMFGLLENLPLDHHLNTVDPVQKPAGSGPSVQILRRSSIVPGF